MSARQSQCNQVTSKVFLPAANGKLKQSSNEHPQEVNVNEIIYKHVNTVSVTYKISATHAIQLKSALIDKGAKGWIAGGNIKLIAINVLKNQHFKVISIKFGLNKKKLEG